MKFKSLKLYNELSEENALMFGFIREVIADVLCLRISDFFIVPTVAHYENKLEVYSVDFLYCFTFKYITL